MFSDFISRGYHVLWNGVAVLMKECNRNISVKIFCIRIFITCLIIVAGYYGFTLDIPVSGCTHYKVHRWLKIWTCCHLSSHV